MAEPEVQVEINNEGYELRVYVAGKPTGSSLSISWHDYDILCDALDSKSLSSLPMPAQALFEGLIAVLADAEARHR